VDALLFSPDGTQLVTGGSNDGNAVVLWSMPTCVPAKTLTGHLGEVKAVAMTPDQSMVASGGLDMTIRLWHAPSGGLVEVIRDHSNVVNALAIAPDGKTLVSGSTDRSIRFWNLPSGSYAGSASDPALPVQTVVSFTC
jgi:WD40 repeat protein